MNAHASITREIYEAKYPASMAYENYMMILEEGFELLRNSNHSIETRTELKELKAIRMALEYRLEVVRQFRKKQIQSIGGLNALLN